MSNYGFDLNYTTHLLASLRQPTPEECIEASKKQMEEDERMLEAIREKVMGEYNTMIYRPWLAQNPEPEEDTWLSPAFVQWFRDQGANPPLTEQDVSGLVGAGVGELKDYLTKVSSQFFNFTYTEGVCFGTIDLTPNPDLHGRFIQIDSHDIEIYALLFYLDCETGRVVWVKSDDPDPYNTLLS